MKILKKVNEFEREIIIKTSKQWNKVKSYFYVPNQNVGIIHLHYTKSNNSLREMNTSLKNIAISFLDLFVGLVNE